MKNKNLEDILSRYKAGTSTEEENALVENWIMFGGVDVRELSEGEINEDLLKIEEGLPLVKHTREIKLWPRIAAAAVLIIALSLGGYFYIRPANRPIEYANDIAPGGNKAILILANGKRINLGDVEKGEIANESGTVVKKTSSGQIIYIVNDQAGADPRGESGFNTIEVPAGGQYQVNLPDGSRVWLNAYSSLHYPVRFTHNERKVEITGEAYFEVAHNKAMPFRVKSANQTVEVLGTHFNVMAYPDEKVTKTTLLEGSVKVSNALGMKVLVPGQQAEAASAAIHVIDNVDVEDVVAWKNGYFKFHSNLEGIMTKIARWYNIEVIYNNMSNPSLEFEGEISRARNISAVLRIMESTGNVHFKVEGRRVTVEK